MTQSAPLQLPRDPFLPTQSQLCSTGPCEASSARGQGTHGEPGTEDEGEVPRLSVKTLL